MLLEAAGEVRELYLEALRKEEGVDIDVAIRTGSFVSTNTPGGRVDHALAYLESAFAKAIGEGRMLLRVVSEMASVRNLFEPAGEMMRYEAAFNMIAKRFPNVTLCQYDVRAFDGATVYEVLRAHPDLYSLRLGSLLS